MEDYRDGDASNNLLVLRRHVVGEIVFVEAEEAGRIKMSKVSLNVFAVSSSPRERQRIVFRDS